MLVAWPPRFEEDLHPRSGGGKFARKFKAGESAAPKKAAPQKAGAPGVPKPGAPTPGAAKKAAPAPSAAKKAAPTPSAAAKKAAPSGRPQRRAMRYDASSAARLQASAQLTPTPTPPSAPGPAERVDDAIGPSAPIPTGGLGPMAQMLAIGRQPDGTMDFDQRAAYVDQRLTYMRANHIDTEAKFRLPLTPAQEAEQADVEAHNAEVKRTGEGKKRDNVVGDWHPDRLALQEQLMDEIWDARAAHVPNEGRAIFSGGLGGAGKGYTLGKIEQVSDRDFFTVNPDDVKELMAKRGMVPLEFDPNMTPMELSPTVHEEASELANRLAERAYAEKKNLVWDITMSSDKSVAEKRIKPMREAGYTDIGALFVDTTVENSITQAKNRWIRGMNDFINGKGEGGRYLPSKATEENLPRGDEYRSNNREVFERVKHLFDGSVIYENLGDGSGTNHLETTGKGIPK